MKRIKPSHLRYVIAHELMMHPQHSTIGWNEKCDNAHIHDKCMYFHMKVMWIGMKLNLVVVMV